MSNKFEHILEDVPNLEFSDVFSDAYDLFKNNFGNLVGYTLILGVSYFVSSFMGSLFISVESQDITDSSFLAGKILVGQLINFLLGMVVYIMVAGFYTFLRSAKNGKPEFNRFWDSFKKFGQIIGCNLLQILFMAIFLSVIFAIVFAVGMNGFDTNSLESFFEDLLTPGKIVTTIIALLVFVYVPLIVIYLLYVFSIPLIVDANLGVWEAMETSRKVVMKRFFLILAICIVLALMTSFGTVITCYLGALALVPFGFCVIFTMYNTLFKPHELSHDLVSEFGQAEIDQNMEEDPI